MMVLKEYNFAAITVKFYKALERYHVYIVEMSRTREQNLNKNERQNVDSI